MTTEQLPPAEPKEWTVHAPADRWEPIIYYPANIDANPVNRAFRDVAQKLRARQHGSEAAEWTVEFAITAGTVAKDLSGWHLIPQGQKKMGFKVLLKKDSEEMDRSQFTMLDAQATLTDGKLLVRREGWKP
jgi:hypothetical protein